MEQNLFAMYDGTYLLVETEDPCIFLFMREDRSPLGDYGTKPLELYQAYVTHKMQKGEMPTDVVAKNVFYEDMKDYNVLRMWVYTFGEEPDFLRNIMRSDESNPGLLN